MIGKISQYLASKLLRIQGEDTYDSEEYEIIEYGIECLINTFIPIVFYVIYSLIYRLFLEMLVWLSTFLIIRNFIGGYHASSHAKCILFSTVFGILSLNSIQYIAILSFNSKLIILAVILALHTIAEPIIRYEEKENKRYKEKTKALSLLFLIITAALAIIFSVYNATLSNAILTGILSAELLYIPEFLR